MPTNSANSSGAPRATQQGPEVNKIALIDAITCEEKHRRELQAVVDVWDNRINILEKLGEEIALGAMVTNAYGRAGEHKSLRELVKQFHRDEIEDGKWAETIKEFTQGFRDGCKYSRWKEKFYRYIYRGERDNAQKYHDKLCEREVEMIEDSRETHARGDNVGYVVNHEVNGGGPELTSSEEGFRKFCEQMTSCNALRRKLLTTIPAFRNQGLAFN